MPDGRLNAQDVASALGVSQRTLARRLGAAQTTFRALLDDELKRRAAALLLDRSLRRDEIAERLGYVEPTSFSRACRRWFGGGGRATRPLVTEISRLVGGAQESE
jgi:AraC-like DNA-binding protein